ncbi:F-box domain-containing protein [Mycena venus]|uniref:F-box domain-containing protein n=1 Tax=Mycena venus TaxID=2733690 RepID=A0A8H7D950_9AGAR|nr:F-box domain-containing protein [Mycena venus]
MALPTTYSQLDPDDSVLNLDEVALPFPVADPAAEVLQRSVRNVDAVNYVRVEAWKSLRIPRLKSKFAPDALSMLPSMQLDIVLEILGYLHPLELLQVSRTNKAFHELLRSPVTDSTWRNSFMVEDHPDSPPDQLPQCPSQLSGRRWAKLLFGAQICEECGQRESSTDFDYALWRRVCDTCVEVNLLETMPGYDASHEIYSMIPTTTRVGLDYDGPFDFARGRFWRDDGVAVASQYEAHVAAAGGPESEAVRRFVQEQQALVEKNASSPYDAKTGRGTPDASTRVSITRCWTRSRLAQQSASLRRGFDERDVQASWYEISACEPFYRMPRLTSRLWNRARPHILPHVVKAKIERLARERETRIARRKEAIISAALMALRAPVPGSRHTYYIPPHTIDTFPPIAQLISEDSEEPLSPDDPRLATALAAAPAFVDAWAFDTRWSLVALFPDPAPEYDYDLQPGLHWLERATSVFKVQRANNSYNNSRDAFIGWEGARAHLHWCHGRPYGERLVEFDPRGSTAAAALAVLLGLDAVTVTALEMDQANARFVCGTCPPESQGRRLAMGWRDCVRFYDFILNLLLIFFSPESQVFHASSSDAATHSAPNWLLLSPMAAADVRRREEPDDYSSLCVWSCTLCKHFIPSFSRQINVRDHLRTNHQVAEPAEGEHFFCFLGPEIPRQRRVMLFVGGAHPARYRCNRCAQALPHVVKLFSLRAIRLHVQDKHLVEFSDDEYTEFELLTPDVAAP